MPLPNNSPRRKKGTPIRVTTPDFGTVKFHSGKPAFFEPNQLVYVGIERRGETDRRDKANDRRYEWRTPDPKKVTPQVWGRRLVPSRKYDPIKFKADKLLPAEWFTQFQNDINRVLAEQATKHKTTPEEIRKRLAAQLGKTGQHMGMALHKRNGSVYMITYNPVDNSFYWSSTRRISERRKADRRSSLRDVNVDGTVN